MFAMENIYFTDCLLRNMNSYRFMMHVDPDEVPVLLQHETLPELIADLSLTLVNETIWVYDLLRYTHMRILMFELIAKNK